MSYANYSATAAGQDRNRISPLKAESRGSIGQSWRRNWPRLTPFFDYLPEIRKVIYTTNAIESVNMSLRKLTKNRGSFPSDETLLKFLFGATQHQPEMDYADS